MMLVIIISPPTRPHQLAVTRSTYSNILRYIYILTSIIYSAVFVLLANVGNFFVVESWDVSV